VSDSGIIGEAYGRNIHASEVVAIDEAGHGLCWVRLTRFGDEWLLIRSDARDVSRAVRKLRQIPVGEQSDGSRRSGREPAPLPCPGALAAAVIFGLSTDVRAAACLLLSPRRR